MGTTVSRNQAGPDAERVLTEHFASDDEDMNREERGEERRRRDSSEERARGDSSSEEEEEERDLFGGGGGFSDVLGRFERTVVRPPRVHETRSVTCDVNIAKETLRLMPISSEGEKEATLYQVRFNFDANVDCRIKLFFVAQEIRDENNRLIGYSSRSSTEVPPLQFAAGLDQEYVQPVSCPFDTSPFQQVDLEYNPSSVLPVVIVIEPLVIEKHIPKVTSQSIFATLLKCSDETYAIKAVKVKIEYCNTTYVVHDIYGLDQNSEAGKECVICMTDSRDTIVLPCRHMCLCRGCAEVLRYQTNKCPICRSLFTALVRIEVAETQEEEGLKSKKKKKRGEKHDLKKEAKKSKHDHEREKELPVVSGTPAESPHRGGSPMISVAN